MKIEFWKYQGTGNDFVMLDGRSHSFKELSSEKIRQLCDRRFGIGADGLIILENHPEADFYMRYYNSDGNISSMCGNGGRCITRFASDLGLTGDKYHFVAIDGDHESYIEDDLVYLKMSDVADVSPIKGRDYFLNTGSPHYISFMDQVPAGSINDAARVIRNSETYRQEGVNVNFVSLENSILRMRTYERGVEDETLSCGTGVTAAVLSADFAGMISGGKQVVEAPGGRLEVAYQRRNNGYAEVWLIGPAVKVYHGEIEV